MKPARLDTSEDQPLPKPKKRVQFRNVATEPEVLESSEQASESNGVSREDTMVEHSVVVNEGADQPLLGESDYMQALESAKLDLVVDKKIQKSREVNLGTCLEAGANEGEVRRRVLHNNFTGFSNEEDLIIEKTLL